MALIAIEKLLPWKAVANRGIAVLLLVLGLGAGEGFGEIALTANEVPRSAIVRATTTLTLRGLSRATFVIVVAGCSPSANAVDDVIDGHLARLMPTQLA